jgi:pyrimidine operon attenuation protein/uracil phosphoribosyltransferase
MTTSQNPTAAPHGPCRLLDGPAIDRALRRIAHEIIERNPDLARVSIIGIPTRGVTVARRLASFIETFEGRPVDFGCIDISMHRDDLHTRGKLSPVEASQLPQNLDGRTIILADDVLFSGRTCRAAMDALSDFGRPEAIQLAVLVDRGHRQLPIRADYVGKNLPTRPGQRVTVTFREDDGAEDGVWLETPEER